MDNAAARAFSGAALRGLLGAALAAASQGAAADTIALNLNDDAVRLTYVKPLAERKLEVDGGWLHHQDNGDVIALGLHRTGEASPGQQPVEAGLGGKLFFLDADRASQDGGVLGVGGFFRFQLAGYDRIGFGGHAYIAPDVIAFGDVERYLEVAARITYSVIRDGDLYLGARYVNADFEAGEVTFDTGLHLGFQLSF